MRTTSTLVDKLRGRKRKNGQRKNQRSLRTESSLNKGRRRKERYESRGQPCPYRSKAASSEKFPLRWGGRRFVSVVYEHMRVD